MVTGIINNNGNNEKECNNLSCKECSCIKSQYNTQRTNDVILRPSTAEIDNLTNDILNQMSQIKKLMFSDWKINIILWIV